MKLTVKNPGFNIKALLMLIVGGVLALYFMGALLPGVSTHLVASNYTNTDNATNQKIVSNPVASAIIVLMIPTFIAVILLKLFGYI